MKIVKTPNDINQKIKRGAKVKYPFRELKLTESIVFDYDEKMYMKVKSAMYQFKKHNPDFVLTMTTDRFMNIFYVTRY